MKKQKLVTLILLMLLLTSTIQFKQNVSKYLGKVAFYTESPATAIVCFANTLMNKDHWKSGARVLEILLR